MDVVVGTGEQSVYLAFGKNPQQALEKVLDRSQENANQEMLPAEMSVALKPILRFAAALDSNPAVKARWRNCSRPVPATASA